MNKYELTEMAQRLEQVRKEEGLSQDAFAARLGVSRGAYQHYTRGGRDMPSRVLMALYDEFQVDPFWMAQGKPTDELSPREQKILINAAKMTVLMISKFKKYDVEYDSERLLNAVEFAVTELLSPTQEIDENEEKLDKYVRSQK